MIMHRSVTAISTEQGHDTALFPRIEFSDIGIIPMSSVILRSGNKAGLKEKSGRTYVSSGFGLQKTPEESNRTDGGIAHLAGGLVVGAAVRM